jgi:hypothetical protein
MDIEPANARNFIAGRFCRFGRFSLLPVIAGAWIFAHPATLEAATASLAWEPAGTAKIYTLYYGTSSRSYTSSVSVTNTTGVVLNNLLGGTTYYFAVTATSTNYLESDYSTEMVYTPSGTPVGPNLGNIQIRVSPTTRLATLSGTGTPGKSLYVRVASSPVGPWSNLTNITVAPNGAIQYTDPTRATLSSRFYRLSDSP